MTSHINQNTHPETLTQLSLKQYVSNSGKESKTTITSDIDSNEFDKTLQKILQWMLSKNMRDMGLSEGIVLSQGTYDFILDQIHKSIPIKSGENWRTPIAAYSYRAGIFTFFDKKENILSSVNVLYLYNIAQLRQSNPQKFTQIQEQTYRENLTLQETFSRESMMDGSIIMEFATTGAVVATGGSVLWNISKNTPKLLQNTTQLVNVWFKNADGVMEKMPLGDSMYVQSRDWAKKNLFKILEKTGVYYNPVQRTFVNVGSKAVTETLQILKTITFSEFRKKYGPVAITEAGFKKFKEGFPHLATTLQQSGNSMIRFTELVTNKALHAIMFPVFYSAFHKQQNSANLVAGVTEMILFNQGARVGAKIGRIAGPVGKIAGPLVGGGAALIGGHKLYEKLDGDIMKWKIFNGPDQFSQNFSLPLHVATAGVVNDALDLTNDAISKMSGEQNKSDFNVRIPGGDWGRNLPTKGPLIMPDVFFYKKTIDFTTNPRNWFNESMPGIRTVAKWNAQVDAYNQVLRTNVAKILGAFYGNKYPFHKMNMYFDEKKKILKQYLTKLIIPYDPNSPFSMEAQLLIACIFQEINRWHDKRAPENINRSIKFIGECIDNYVSYMKIDDYFIQNFQRNIALQSDIKQGIPGDIENLAKQIEQRDTPASQQQAKYLRGLYKRVISGEGLYSMPGDGQTPIIRKYGDIQSIVGSEQDVFNQLLDSKIMIDIPIFDTEGNIAEYKKIEVGKVFVHILERLALHTQNREFIKNISDLSLGVSDRLIKEVKKLF